MKFGYAFFKLHSKDEYFERQEKGIVILIESFFLIAKSIFNTIFNKFNLIKYTQRMSLHKYLTCLKILPRTHQIIKIRLPYYMKIK